MHSASMTVSGRLLPAGLARWGLRLTLTASQTDRKGGAGCDGRSCLQAACPAKRAAEGRLAQLVEHLVYTERVSGSSPLSPTIFLPQFDWPDAGHCVSGIGLPEMAFCARHLGRSRRFCPRAARGIHDHL